jgi:CheY-like chemotaxis protein
MSRRRTVLIVEDEPDLLDFAQVTLRLGGYRPVPVSEGGAVLAAARESRPDVVLLDLRLPGIDGWEVLAELRADAALQRVPVVILTAMAEPEGRERAQADGVAGYLVKPVSASALLAAVGKALDGAG